MKWLESNSSKCRWADQVFFDDADIIWEDSTIGISGKVLCVGFHNESYFYLQWEYPPYVVVDIAQSTPIVYFKDTSEIKKWLKELKQSGYDKADEIIDIMRFLIT